MRSTIVMILAALMLTACASGLPPMPAPSLPRLPPPNLMLHCPELAQPASGGLVALLANHIDVAQEYQICRERQRALAEWARSAPAPPN